MTTEADEQAGGAFGDKIKGIAQMQAGDGATGAFDDATFAGGKGEDRTVQFLLDARGEDADDTFVPAFIKKCNAGGSVIGVQRFEQDQRLFLR